MHMTDIVQERSDYYKKMTSQAPKKVEVGISENPFQAHAVFHGASMMALSDSFQKSYHTRDDYLEKGSSIARHNPVFMDG